MLLMHELRSYASPKARITRMLNAGDLIQVRRGVFLDAGNHDYSIMSLAAVIYGPSYISFEYALGYYGLVPERVEALTSATYCKNKNRTFQTPLGNFHYYYLPASIYPYGILRKEEQTQGYLLATPEKALLDTLYKAKGISSVKSLTSLLFDDWRMEYERIASMDSEGIAFMAPRYRKKATTLFFEWFKREALNA